MRERMFFIEMMAEVGSIVHGEATDERFGSAIFVKLIIKMLIEF
jgi:hypothetical protein